MDYVSLVKDVNLICCAVFENEADFMTKLCKPCEWDELLEFYMASTRCRVEILLSCGTTVTNTIQTADVIAWHNSLSK